MSDLKESNLKDKTALVTGASSGIGKATAEALARAGARVTLAARRGDRLEALANDLPGSDALVLDVRDATAVEAALSQRTFDIVLANAGMARGTALLPSGNPQEWSDILDTNIKGVLHVLHATMPAMLARGSGDVVLLGSVAGRQVYRGGNVYCASKHAVRALYEALRADSSNSSLRFTTIDPGMVQTEFSDVRLGDKEKAAAVYADMTPLEPADVADAILWAITRPGHVNVGEIVLWPTDQASTSQVHRR